MADQTEVMLGIKKHDGVVYSALTPNMLGFEAAVSEIWHHLLGYHPHSLPRQPSYLSNYWLTAFIYEIVKSSEDIVYVFKKINAKYSQNICID